MQHLIFWGKGLLILTLLMNTLAAQIYSRSGQPAPAESKALARNVGCGGSTLLFESFDEATLPSDWRSLDEDGGTPNPNIQFITPQGGWQVIPDLKDSSHHNRAVASPSWYQDQSLRSSDWLILPQTQPLPANVCFSFLAYSQDLAYPEAYEVRISTTGGDPADFMQTEPLLVVEAESGDFTYRSIDLSDYVGEEVYLAIHHTSLDAFILVMDDFRLAQVKRRDLAIFDLIEWDDPEPGIEYLVEGVLVNRGLDSLRFGAGEVTVGYETYGNIYRDVLDSAFTLAPNDTLHVRHDDLWEPPVQGRYGFNFFVEPIEGDEDLSNDTLYQVVPVGITVSAPSPTAWSWQMAPNPTSGQLRLSFDQPLRSPVRLTLTDLTGRAVLPAQTLPSGRLQYEMSLDQLPAGLYYLTLRSAAGIHGQAKVRKQ